MSGLIDLIGEVLGYFTQKNFWLRMGLAVAGAIAILIGIVILARKPLETAGSVVAKAVV